LAQVKLQLIRLKISCDCGKTFLCEELETRCPFCGKKYVLEITLNHQKQLLEAKPTNLNHF